MAHSDIIQLRHELHKNPEISNNEYNTSRHISNFIKTFQPDEIFELSKTGKAFVFSGKKPGKTLMFRAELDALPIQETPVDIDYFSINANVAHVCGHDGHMAILAGLAQKIAEVRPEKGRVVLLFQPAEEVQQGARDVIEDHVFKQITPDYIFALHNIPGVEKNKILLKNGTFAAASKGMTVKLTGKTSHAAEPEFGRSPADAVSKIISQLHQMAADKQAFSDLTLLTIIHIRMGEISFGTTPGFAEIMITLRAFENKDMELITEKAEKIITKIAKEEKLLLDISYGEVFPATANNEECVQIIENSAIENEYKTAYLKAPFKWSEDFGYYTQNLKGGFFGLGAGVHQPPLHNPDFDFPDEIIETGINVFFNIYKTVNL